MKKTLKTVSWILLLTMVSFLACNLADDEDPEPGDPRSKFLGTWNVNETCNKGIYSVQISEDPDNSDQILIKNFANPGYGVGDPAVGRVSGDKVTLDPSHKIGDNWTVTGTGVYTSNDRMDWEYDLIISGTQQSCSATFTK